MEVVIFWYLGPNPIDGPVSHGPRRPRAHPVRTGNSSIAVTVARVRLGHRAGRGNGPRGQPVRVAEQPEKVLELPVMLSGEQVFGAVIDHDQMGSRMNGKIPPDVPLMAISRQLSRPKMHST